MAIYRKIYEQHFGLIPQDELGRSYEIHHIDGNRKNNDISNLKCVSIQEHYDIHLSQGDYGACFLIAKRLNMSRDEISDLARKAGQKLIQQGRHNWQGDGTLQRRNANRLIGEGKHHFIGDTNPSTKRAQNGTHHWFNTESQKENQLKRVREGTHHLLGGDISKKLWDSGIHRKRMEDGTHHNTIKHTCPYCNKMGKGPMMKRWHFDNCKFKN